MRKFNQARLAAIAAGDSTYSTGVPCKHGHNAPRHVKNHACTVCCLALSKAWNKANPEKTLAAGRKSYAKDPSKAAARYAKRRANKKQATPAWVDTKELQKFYLEARLKTLESEFAWEVDHIVPLNGVNVCGLHVPWNLQVIPAVDNRRKQNRLTT